jgi:hypothetical protein
MSEKRRKKVFTLYTSNTKPQGTRKCISIGSGMSVCWNDTTNFACRDRKAKGERRLASKRLKRVQEEAAHRIKAAATCVCSLYLLLVSLSLPGALALAHGKRILFGVGWPAFARCRCRCWWMFVVGSLHVYTYCIERTMLLPFCVRAIALLRVKM